MLQHELQRCEAAVGCCCKLELELNESRKLQEATGEQIQVCTDVPLTHVEFELSQRGEVNQKRNRLAQQLSVSSIRGVHRRHVSIRVHWRIAQETGVALD